MRALKPRHAAALALVGWYLVAPGAHSMTHDYMGGVLFSRWYRLGVLETAAQCDQALQIVKARVASVYDKELRSGHKLTFQFGDAAECSDYPSESNLPKASSSDPIRP
jgi:hypothetical protein